MPRAGTLIPEEQKSFEPETANQKPFSWGSKGAILFCEREWPLCPVQRHRRCFPRGAARRLKLWEQVNDLREHEKRRLNA